MDDEECEKIYQEICEKETQDFEKITTEEELRETVNKTLVKCKEEEGKNVKI